MSERGGFGGQPEGPATLTPLQETLARDLVIEDVEYLRHGDALLLATVYRPRGTSPYPVLVDVHGGAWNAGSRLSDAGLDIELASEGVVVIAVDHRLAPAHPYPASVIDVNYAIRWAKAHAKDYGGDARRLGAIGLSSGGHIVMLNALRPRDPRYTTVALAEAPDVDASLRFVVLAFSIVDPYARYYDVAKGTNNDRLVAATEAFFPDAADMEDASPTLILERGEATPKPPVLIFQGTVDTNVTPAIAERFVSAYRKAGGEIEYHRLEGIPHQFFRAARDKPEVEGAIAAVKRFVRQNTGL